jgi:hypothetical protein
MSAVTAACQQVGSSVASQQSTIFPSRIRPCGVIFKRAFAQLCESSSPKSPAADTAESN